MTGRHLKLTRPDTQLIGNATKRPRLAPRHRTDEATLPPMPRHPDITPPRYVADLRARVVTRRVGPSQYHG